MAEEMEDDLEEDDADQEMIDLHEECMREFARVQTAMYQERQLCREDRRFVDIAGAQYDGILFRNFDNKPKIEFNKVSMSVMRIINEYRNNPITVDFVSKDGEDNTKLASVCDGLFRADMQASNGDLAINNGFEEAVKGGFGAIRVTEEYEDEEDPENESQRIKIEAIYDADTSVYFDLDAKNQDKSDARMCWVLYSMTREAYAEEWGEEEGDGEYSGTSMPKDIPLDRFDWYTPDFVYIAEWFRVEEVYETLQIWTNLAGEEERYWSKEFKEDPTLKRKLEAVQSVFTRKRRIPRKKVHKYLVDGSRILEDCGIIAGKYIPIIPIYGMRSFIDGVERCRGQVRMSKDPQRLYNMQTSKLAELAAYSSMAKPIVHPEQIAGWENLWAEDNVRDNPYLLLNMILGPDGTTPVASGPIAYTQPPPVPPAMAALLQFTDVAMKEILGGSQEMQAVPANTSAEAINSVFNRMDMQVYIFVSNLAIALKWAGNVWLSKARELYTQPGRKMKVLDAQNKTSTVQLMQPVTDKNKNAIYENDITEATFEVVSSVGPASTTKRQATVDTMLKLLPVVSSDPAMVKMLTSLVLLNSDAEGMDDVREYVRAELVKMGVIKPSDEEAEAMAQAAASAQPSATDQAQLAFAQSQKANADKARAQVLQVLAEVEKIQAETERTRVEALEKMQNIDQSEREHVMGILEKLGKPAELPPAQPIGGMAGAPMGPLGGQQ